MIELSILGCELRTSNFGTNKISALIFCQSWNILIFPTNVANIFLHESSATTACELKTGIDFRITWSRIYDDCNWRIQLKWILAMDDLVSLDLFLLILTFLFQNFFIFYHIFKSMDWSKNWAFHINKYNVVYYCLLCGYKRM